MGVPALVFRRSSFRHLFILNPLVVVSQTPSPLRRFLEIYRKYIFVFQCLHTYWLPLLLGMCEFLCPLPILILLMLLPCLPDVKAITIKYFLLCAMNHWISTSKLQISPNPFCSLSLCNLTQMF